MVYIINTDFSKYKTNKYIGLKNLGNTCFLNSSIQVLNHTYELIDLLHREKTRGLLNTEINDHYITEEFNRLYLTMNATPNTFSPDRFVSCVQQISQRKGRELFTGWAQNDMPEFLLFMIECLHNSISRPVTLKISGKSENHKDELALKCLGMLRKSYEKEYSEVMHLFYGIYVSQIKSVGTSEVLGISPECYFMIDLPIPQASNPTLNQCFDLYTQIEVLEGDNAYFNEKTGKKEAVTKNITFWSFPQILVITLKRFQVSHYIKKIEDFVDFPLENLDLSKYCSGYNPQNYVYDLYGVCNHFGNTMGGHYTSFVKTADNTWIHCNDQYISIVQNSAHIKTNNAYCLFYRKKNTGL
jgi:ubiquitin carboxyl-terminal hydrolase 8